LTIELWKDWEKGDDFLYYLRPDGKEIEVFSSNDHIASDASSLILEVPFFKYTKGNVLQLYSDVTTNQRFIVTNLTNTIKNTPVPEPGHDASAGCRPDRIGRIWKKETAQEKKVIQFKVESLGLYAKGIESKHYRWSYTSLP